MASAALNSLSLLWERVGVRGHCRLRLLRTQTCSRDRRWPAQHAPRTATRPQTYRLVGGSRLPGTPLLEQSGGKRELIAVSCPHQIASNPSILTSCACEARSRYPLKTTKSPKNEDLSQFLLLTRKGTRGIVLRVIANMLQEGGAAPHRLPRKINDPGSIKPRRTSTRHHSTRRKAPPNQLRTDGDSLWGYRRCSRIGSIPWPVPDRGAWNPARPRTRSSTQNPRRAPEKPCLAGHMNPFLLQKLRPPRTLSTQRGRAGSSD
jgi:hypothetical protein